MFDQNSFNSIFLLKQLISQKTKPLWSDAANKSVILKKKKRFKRHIHLYTEQSFLFYFVLSYLLIQTPPGSYIDIQLNIKHEIYRLFIRLNILCKLYAKLTKKTFHRMRTRRQLHKAKSKGKPTAKNLISSKSKLKKRQNAT